VAVYLLALGAALLFGLGSVVQQRVAFEAPPGSALRPRLLWWLVRQPVWLIGVGTALVGNLLAGAALGLGTVALVQPLLVSRLLFALPLSAAWARQRLAGRDWLGMLATAGGLGVFVAVGQPEAATEEGASLWSWGGAVAAIGLLTLVLVLVARRYAPQREAPMLGAGAGMLFGLQSGLTDTAVTRFFDDGVLALLTTWTTYGVAVAAVAGTLLAQSAYSMAPLAASYPALAAVEPLAGIGIGVGVLGSTLVLGPGPIAVQAVALATMTVGIWLLATSPLVVGQSDLMRRREEEGLVWRSEEELSHELDGLDRDLHRLEAHREPADRHEDVARVCSDLVQVDAALARVAGLQEDLRRQRATARTTPPEGDIARHERALDVYERQMAAWEESLRTRAGELRRRAEVLRAR
jgi:drug/metabolite transporter (DMT)-like permease